MSRQYAEKKRNKPQKPPRPPMGVLSIDYDKVKWQLSTKKCRGQSPVDIQTHNCNSVWFAKLKFNNLFTLSKNSTVKNDGQTLIIRLEGGLVSGGPLWGSYRFLQMNWHWAKSDEGGTEHAIDGKRFSCEAHFLFQADEGRDCPTPVRADRPPLCVLGVMFRASENGLKPRFCDYIDHVTETDASVIVDGNLLVDFQPYLKETAFFNYSGSLTTEPYTENVEWIVYKEVYQINRLVINAFQKLHNSSGDEGIEQNVRMLQGLSSRIVNQTIEEESFSRDAPTYGQSPVDIRPTKTEGKWWPPLVISNLYNPTAISRVLNTGHTLKIEVKGGLLTGGPLYKKYSFLQVHFHWGRAERDGSEHAIEGKRFACEAHFVFQANECRGSLSPTRKERPPLCVLGVLFRVSDNEPIHNVYNYIDKLIEPNKSLVVNENLLIDFEKYLRPTDYYTYSGSLTNPPYTENVQWIVYKQIFAMNRLEIDGYRSLKGPKGHGRIKENVRDLQALGARTIFETTETAANSE